MAVVYVCAHGQAAGREREGEDIFKDIFFKCQSSMLEKHQSFVGVLCTHLMN